MTEVQDTLVELQSLGYSQSSIERILELPQNALTNEEDNAEAKALMQIIKTYPWILQVADAKYDKKIAKQIAVYNAGQTLSRMAKDLK